MSVGTTAFLYISSARGGSDAPIAGELGLGTEDVAISRIFYHGATQQLRINEEDGTFSPEAYFEAGGDGNDLRLSVQTLDGVRTVEVASALHVDSGAGNARFTMPTDFQTLLTDIDIGDRFIFTLWRPTAAPEAPTEPTITDLQRFQATVNWVEPEDNNDPITRYDLEWREGSTGSWTEVSDLTGISHILTILDANTVYQARVRATNSEGNSAYSTAVSFTTTASPVSTATQVSFSRGSDGIFDYPDSPYLDMDGTAYYLYLIDVDNEEWISFAMTDTDSLTVDTIIYTNTSVVSSRRSNIPSTDLADWVDNLATKRVVIAISSNGTYDPFM